MNKRKTFFAFLTILTITAVACSPTPIPVQTAPQAPASQAPALQTQPQPQAPAQVGDAMLKAGFVDQLEIQSVADAYGGASFGNVGPYQVVSGIVHGKINPTHPMNTIIVDLDKAPVGADGYVEYTTDFVILRPKNPATAKRLLFYEVNNRGNKSTMGTLILGAGTNFEKGSEGDGFLYRQGYTLVYSGWQGDVPQTGLSGKGAAIGTNFPVAKNKDGSAITGLSREEIVFDDNQSPTSFTLTYPAATMDKSKVVFNARKTWVTPNGMTWDSPSVNIPPSDWDYINDKQVVVKRPTSVDAGAIYSFVYPAKDPIVMGIGFAAVRDFVTFLRYDSQDAKGTLNPLNDLKQAPCVIKNASGACPSNPTSTVDVAIGEGQSQSGRFLRDVLYQGFNDDTRGHKLFEGLMPLRPAARRTYTNFRWSQPGRWSKGHEDHFQPGDQFPFAFSVTDDPISGANDGLMKKCLASNTCPKIMQIDGAFEVWGGRASLMVVDSTGKEIPIPDNVRLYMVAGTQHGGGNGVGTETRPATCQNLSSAVIKRPVYRALVPAMEAWLVSNTPPPASRYPNLKDGTLAPITSREKIGFPDLSKIGVNFPTIYNQIFVTDYSDAIPVANLSKQYQLLVPTTDADGNDVAGIRVPDVSVPIATYTGWNIRKAGFAEGDTCGSTGSTIPFSATAAARQANGDPRPSLAERYTSKADYVSKVEAAAKALVSQGYILQEDVTFFVNQAQKVTVLQ